jgi:hypothetical protein
MLQRKRRGRGKAKKINLTLPTKALVKQDVSMICVA